MLIKKPSDIKEAEVSDRQLFEERRRFLRDSMGTAGTIALISAIPSLALNEHAFAGTKLSGYTKSPLSTEEEVTAFDKVTSYNNFYEFGTDKGDPYRNAQAFRTRPWSLAVEGECERPGAYQLEDFLKPYQLEERIYRLRCVEAWSMVVPWLGIPLATVIKSCQPTSRAKFVEFETLYDPEQMPGQRQGQGFLGQLLLDWPYREGLRIDEAVHPLTLLTIGLFGEELPNQNGAPIRLVVPWKYGFKSIKSIVKIRFTERMPATSWNRRAPDEYGFYANVNPDVDHPRWSQKKERRIGDFFKRDTLMFNGYADQVAHLYAGMNLKKFF